MSRFLAKDLAGLAPYVPGEQPRERAYIKLNTNENPYFPSRYAMDAIDRAALENLRLYSDPESAELSDAIADCYGLRRENVLPTNGSDEILAFCFRAFGARGLCFPDVTYGFYPVFAALFGQPFRKIPLRPDFTVDPADYAAAGETVVLANPNAQTGIYLPLGEIENIVRSDPDRVVIVDEAYIDFGGESAAALVEKYDNLVVVQTFSKSRSLAGARVGFALACPGLIADLSRVKYSFNPYNVNRLSAALAARAIADRAYFEECRRKIIASRAYLAGALAELGFEALPSLANFVLAKKPGVPGERLYAELRARGFLVRHFPDERIRDYIRITVGTDKDMRALAGALAEVTK